MTTTTTNTTTTTTTTTTTATTTIATTLHYTNYTAVHCSTLQIQLQLHYITLHYNYNCTTLRYITLDYTTLYHTTVHYTTLITPHHSYNCNYATLFTLHYNYNSTTLHYNYNYNYSCTSRHYIQQLRWGDHCNHFNKHSSNHLRVHQWIRSAIRDSQQPPSPIGFLFLKLRPPPCAVLLALEYIFLNPLFHHPALIDSQLPQLRIQVCPTKKTGVPHQSYFFIWVSFSNRKRGSCFVH